MVELLSLLFDVLHVLLDLQLLLPALEGIGVQKFAIESPDLLGVLEEFLIGNRELLLFLLELEASFFFIDFPAFELLLLEFPEALLLLSFFEVLGVVDPLIGPLLALLILMESQVVFAFYKI